MRKRFRRYEPGQRLLFPPTIEEFVPSDHPAHFVRRLVSEQLDLGEIESAYSEERGAPPFDPAMMTSLLLYAYMRGEYSSRRIAQACVERVDFMAVTAMNRPDFRTVAKFRTRHGKALQGLFSQVVQLCQESHLVELRHVAVDGTKLKGNASHAKNKTYQQLQEEERAIEKSIKEWFEKADAIDKAEDAEHGEDDSGTPSIPSVSEALKKIQEAKERLAEREKERQEHRDKMSKEGIDLKQKRRTEPRASERYNLTDSDTRLISAGGGNYIQGYNGQLAVDSHRQVVVSCHVSSTGNDKHELRKTLPRIEAVCGQQARELSADSDYFTAENLKLLEDYGVEGYIAVGKGRTNPTIPAIVPPQGSLREKMVLKLRKAGRRTRYRLRKVTVEPVFGMIKAARGFRRFLLRGLEKVNIEWTLVCTAHNLWKLQKHG